MFAKGEGQSTIRPIVVHRLRQADFALHRFKINSSTLQIISPEWRTINTGEPRPERPRASGIAR